jgi:hypothetical protein
MHLLRQMGVVPSTKAFGGRISVVCLTRTSRYRSKRRSWLVPLLPTLILSCLLASWTNVEDFVDAKCRCNLVNWESSNFGNWKSTVKIFKIRIFFATSQNSQDTNILTKHHSIITQARFAGRGQNSGRAGRGPENDRGQGPGHGTGYTSKPKTSKVGLCKELENNVINYGIPNATDLMCTTQEKIGQYIGIKYGEDIANELTNKAMVTIPPPVYSTAILLRHQDWERHVRRK